jgi:hypothetical protein
MVLLESVVLDLEGRQLCCRGTTLVDARVDAHFVRVRVY